MWPSMRRWFKQKIDTGAPLFRRREEAWPEPRKYKGETARSESAAKHPPITCIDSGPTLSAIGANKSELILTPCLTIS